MKTLMEKLKPSRLFTYAILQLLRMFQSYSSQEATKYFFPKIVLFSVPLEGANILGDNNTGD